MKITKLLNGEGAAIMLSMEELEQLAKIYVESKPTEQENGGGHNFKGLSSTTKLFLEKFKEKFGYSAVDYSNRDLEDLLLSIKVRFLSLQKTLLDRKIMAVNTTETKGGRKKIVSIQLLKS